VNSSHIKKSRNLPFPQRTVILIQMENLAKFLTPIAVAFAMVQLGRRTKGFEKAVSHLSDAEKDQLDSDYHELSSSSVYTISFIVVMLIWAVSMSAGAAAFHIFVSKKPEYATALMLPWFFAGLSTSRIPMSWSYRVLFGKSKQQWYEQLWAIGNQRAFSSNVVLNWIARISIVLGFLTTLYALF